MSGANATTLRKHTLRVAERAETELGEERSCFIDGCPADWAKLPIPEGRIVVGLDGGYVRDWEDRKTNFEVIVGQSVPEDRDRGGIRAPSMRTGPRSPFRPPDGPATRIRTGSTISFEPAMPKSWRR